MESGCDSKEHGNENQDEREGWRRHIQHSQKMRGVMGQDVEHGTDEWQENSSASQQQDCVEAGRVPGTDAGFT